MGSFARTTVSLRFWGEDLDPDEITRRLKRLPTESKRKGDPIFSRRGVQRGFTNRGHWRYEVPDRKPGDLNAQIDEIFSTLYDGLDVWRDLTARFEADMFCGLFMGDMNDSVVLRSATMGALTARGVKLSLDVYDFDGSLRRWEDGDFVGNGSDYD